MTVHRTDLSKDTMGANQSAEQELELGKYYGHSPPNPACEGAAHSSNMASKGEAGAGSKAGERTKAGHGFDEHGDSGGHCRPGGVPPMARRDAGGPCSSVQGTRRQAASEPPQPQSGTRVPPSRGPSRIRDSGGRLPSPTQSNFLDTSSKSSIPQDNFPDLLFKSIHPPPTFSDLSSDSHNPPEINSSSVFSTSATLTIRQQICSSDLTCAKSNQHDSSSSILSSRLNTRNTDSTPPLESVRAKKNTNSESCLRVINKIQNYAPVRFIMSPKKQDKAEQATSKRAASEEASASSPSKKAKTAGTKKPRAAKEKEPKPKKDDGTTHNSRDRYATWVGKFYLKAMDDAVSTVLADHPDLHKKFQETVTASFQADITQKVAEVNKADFTATHEIKRGRWGYKHVLVDAPQTPTDQAADDETADDQTSEAKVTAAKQGETTDDIPTETAAKGPESNDDEAPEDGEATASCKTPKLTAKYDDQHTNRTRNPSHIPHTQDSFQWAYHIFTSSAFDFDIVNTGRYSTRAEANTALLRSIDDYENGAKGNAGAVTRKIVHKDCPLKLLKVELTFATGEERVVWVERRLVDLQNDLSKRERRLKKWSGIRPKLPHYIVECEFMTRRATETPQERVDGDCDSDADDDGDRVAPHEVVGAYTGDIELERLPLATFTDRGLANDHAGKLFLRHSAVNEAIRISLDDFWWANNAVPIHLEAQKAAKAPDAVYVAELYTQDMNTRLGFDWMRVAVYAVGDVHGPLNI